MTENHFRFLGLQRLATERGLDVRTTVLRVATDLFCQANAHAPSDIARYADLALALLETADAATRSAVAKKLARAPHTPDRLLRFFLDDPDVTVAGAILAHSPALKLENLAAFLDDCGPGEAAAVARRRDIDAPTIRILAGYPHLLVVETLLENTEITLDANAVALLIARVEGHPDLAALLFAHPKVHPADLAPLYQSAPVKMRARIRAALEERTTQPAPLVPIDALSALNDAVIAADRERIAAALGKALQLDPAGMRRVLDDPTGEVFALALLAAGIKRGPAVNVLLVIALPEVRTSVERIFAAADVHDNTSRRVGRVITAAIAGERRTAPAVFEPHLHPSGTPQRAVGARRRPFVQQQPVRMPDTVGKR